MNWISSRILWNFEKFLKLIVSTIIATIQFKMYWVEKFSSKPSIYAEPQPVYHHEKDFTSFENQMKKNNFHKKKITLRCLNKSKINRVLFWFELQIMTEFLYIFFNKNLQNYVELQNRIKALIFCFCWTLRIFVNFCSTICFYKILLILDRFCWILFR